MSSSDESMEINSTPPELKEEANSVVDNLLPVKSRDKYNRVYDLFMDWKASKKANNFSENVFLAYFSEQSKNKKPTTLWSVYSMLKSMVQIKHNINIKDFTKLTTFLKRQSAGYQSKKSKVFTAENVDRFLTEAPDAKYLAIKVVLILGINGACRSIELTNITTNDIENHENTMIVKLCDTKTKLDRVFVVRGDYLDVVRKYEALRPLNTSTHRFFLNYKDRKCTRQPIGKHKISSMPKEIATFLKLSDAESYTGHCFRRTSATLLADAGANLTTVKRHGGWKSDKVAEGYIEDSIGNKTEITEIINNQIKKQNALENQTLGCCATGATTSTAYTSRQHAEAPIVLSPIELHTSSQQSIARPQMMSSQINVQQTSDIQQTTISAPGKTITFSITNCPNMTNITFNIN